MRTLQSHLRRVQTRLELHLYRHQSIMNSRSRFGFVLSCGSAPNMFPQSGNDGSFQSRGVACRCLFRTVLRSSISFKFSDLQPFQDARNSFTSLSLFSVTILIRSATRESRSSTWGFDLVG